MRRRVRRVSVLLAALLAGAAAAAAVPALAPGSAPPSTASFTAQDFSWHVTGDAASSSVTIAVGGTVTFGYPTGASAHNADFSDGAPPTSCTQTGGTPGGTPPPLPTTPTAAGWSGSCRFDTPGTYTFHCDLHAFMSGTIVVVDPNAPPPPTTTGGGSTGTGGGSGGTTATSPPPPRTGGGSTPGAGTGGSPSSPSSPSATTPGGTSPTGGASAPHVRLIVAHAQRGTVVRGAVVAPVAGARVDAIALVSNAELATHRPRGRARAVRVGERRLRAKAAGSTAFAVRLDAAARGALRRRHSLAVTLRVVVTPPGGRAVVRTVRVVVRRALPAPPLVGYAPGA